MTIEDYLANEETSETRHEYFRGDVFEIEAASFRHQQIGTQLFGALRPALNANGCELYFSGTRVATADTGLYTYPDLVIVCGKPQFWDTDPNTLRNPRAILEILSPGTKDYDRGTKFELYRGLPSLAEYVNVHQDAPYIEHHVRQSDGSWLMRDLRGLDSVLRLASAAVDAPFHAIYAGIEFDPSNSTPRPEPRRPVYCTHT